MSHILQFFNTDLESLQKTKSDTPTQYPYQTRYEYIFYFDSKTNMDIESFSTQIYPLSVLMGHGTYARALRQANEQHFATPMGETFLRPQLPHDWQAPDTQLQPAVCSACDQYANCIGPNHVLIQSARRVREPGSCSSSILPHQIEQQILQGQMKPPHRQNQATQKLLLSNTNSFLKSKHNTIDRQLKKPRHQR